MLKIGDLVEIKNERDEFSPMTERFGGNFGLITDILSVISANKSSLVRYVVFIQERQREYWFDANELKLID
jgi:ADP-dependent phosphofructokinase/glucokinase